MNITKEIKDAVNDILSTRIDAANYGMLSTKRTKISSINVLLKNNIKITQKMCNDDILKDGEVIGKVNYRYASTKRNGMYKMLKPQVIYVK